MSVEPLHVFLPPDEAPAHGFLTPARVLTGFCTANHEAVIMDGRPPTKPPSLFNPFEFTAETDYDHSARGDQDKPEMFRGLLRAAQENMIEYKPEALLSICDADFITDSVTMVQLFRVAGEVFRQEPVVTTNLLHLDLLAQVVSGKVFMKASCPPSGRRFKADATGQFVPPRFGLCDRMKEMNAQSFKRVTAYKLRTTGEHVVPPYGILIQDDDLLEVMEPGLQLDCVALGSCRHGDTAQHAVPIVIQDNHGPLVSLGDLGSRKASSEIYPRVYFAGCEKFCLSRFGADVNKGFCEFTGPGYVFPAALQFWAKEKSGDLWRLANLLRWIHERAKGYASICERDARFRVQLQATSSVEHNGGIIPVYSLTTDRLDTEERLVSEKDVTTLHRWMTGPGVRYPQAPEEGPPPYGPVAYPPPPYAN